MPGYCNTVVVGYLGGDPELCFTPDGSPVVNFSIAVNQSYTDKDGEKHENTLWLKCIVWGKRAEACNQYLSKGSMVLASGALRIKDWETNAGEKRRDVELNCWQVVFLNKKESE